MLTATALGPKAVFGEGPIWDAHARRMWWVDIPFGAVHGTDPVTNETETHVVGAPVSAVWPTETGALIAAHGLSLVELDRADSRKHVIATVPGTAPARLNDGAVSPKGELWVGTMSTPPSAHTPGSVWSMSGRHPRKRVSNVALANGIGWAPDGATLYLVDTLQQRIDAFDVAGGELSGRRVFADVDIADGKPDGLTVDSEGGVWVALTGGARIRRYDTSGKTSADLDLPTATPTGCAFGGPSMQQLFVTTASGPGPDDDPWAGHLLRFDVGVAGIESPPLNLTPLHMNGRTS